MQGLWQCAGKKLKLCGICGMNFAKKHQLHGNVLSRDHQKSILLSKEGDIPEVNSKQVFIKDQLVFNKSQQTCYITISISEVRLHKVPS